MAKAFIENPENLATVDHIDGDKHNNAVTNLQWMTHGDNSRKAWRRNITMINLKDGREDTLINVREFSRRHNLDSSSLSKVLNGKIKHTKGWSVL